MTVFYGERSGFRRFAVDLKKSKSWELSTCHLLFFPFFSWTETPPKSWVKTRADADDGPSVYRLWSERDKWDTAIPPDM